MNTDNLKQQFDHLSSNFKGLASSASKEQAFARYEETGFPKASLEDWRYSNLKGVKGKELINYQADLGESSSEYKNNFDFPVQNIVFRNGIFDKDASQLSDEIMKHVSFKKHGELSSRRKLSQLDENPFFNLNLSFNIETLYINLPNNFVSLEPIVLNFVYDNCENKMLHPQVEIVVGANSQAKFVEYHHLTDSKQNALINSFVKVNQEPGSDVKFVRVANFKNSSVHHTGHIISEVKKDAKFNLTSVNIGGAFNRLDGEFFHLDEGSDLQLNGLCFSKDKEQVNYLSRVFHEKGNGESHQLYKGVLADSSISLFDGLIYIAPKAQKVNSSQMNKNLLLSDEAQVFTKPQLNINADDVKAAHGATVSELNDDEIFYLTSRGINKADAKKIIERAFIDEVILKVGDLNIRNWLKSEVQ